MEKVIGDLQHAMTHIRTGRASINLLDGVKVDYYGTPTPVNQVATLHVPARTSSTQARYIHAAEPVYQDQPPCPTRPGNRYTSAATT